MATVKSESKNKEFECIYNDSYSNTTFLLGIKSGFFGSVAIRIDKYELKDLISTLQDFDEKMRIAGEIK